MLGVHREFSEEELREEPEKVANKLVEMTEKQKHEEEHVEPTLDTFNRLKISIEEFSWEKEDDGVNPNRDSPNGYPTVTPTELQPVTLAH